IVEPHPDADPREPALGSAIHRREEGQRPDEMGREALERFLLPQGLPYEGEVPELEIAQPAVDQLGRARGGAGGEVALLEERDGRAAERQVARDAGPSHASTNDDGVERRRVQTCKSSGAHGTITSAIDRST